MLDPNVGESIPLVPADSTGSVLMFPTWSPDGESVFFRLCDEKSHGNLWSVPASGGTPRLLVRFDVSGSIPHGEFATDGKRFFFTLPEHESDVWVMELVRR